MKEYVFSLSNAKVNSRDQGTVYLALPEEQDETRLRPAVVAIHGSGRSALDYHDTPFYVRQRDLVLEQGALFAAVSNGTDAWGRDDGLYNVLSLMTMLTEEFRVKPQMALWATSAGGLLAHRVIRQVPQKVAFVIGTFPVFDLSAAFARPACKRAWKTEDFEEFSRRIEGRNPATFPQSLAGIKYYVAHGTADSVVPLQQHSARLKQQLGDNVYLETVEQGGHDVENFAYYGKAVEQAFRDFAHYFA